MQPRSPAQNADAGHVNLFSQLNATCLSMEKQLKIEVFAVHENKKSRGLPIQQLPKSSLQLAASLMTLEDRLSLALASKKTEDLLMGLDFPKLGVHLIRFAKQDDGKVAEVHISVTANSILVVRLGVDNQEPDVILDMETTVKKVPKWCNELLSIIDNLKIVYSKICKLIPCHRVAFSLGTMDTLDVKKIFSESSTEWNDWHCTNVNGNLNMEAVRVIMDNANSDRTLMFSPAVNFPVDFTHDKAFQLKKLDCFNAQWVRIEQLLNIRGAKEITLRRTNLTVSEMNRFLRHCLESREQVCETARIPVAQGPIDLHALMNELVFVADNNMEARMRGIHILLGCSETDVRSKYANVKIFNECITSEFFTLNAESPQPHVVEILELMKREKRIRREALRVVERGGDITAAFRLIQEINQVEAELNARRGQ